MKTKKRKSAGTSRFTRGMKVSAKGARRHGRKMAKKAPVKEEFVPELETLTPL